jgi:WD40 repeat protein
MLESITATVPKTPYRGILPFLYGDHPIFFARERETRDLIRHTVIYRGVFLYGESGAGKSSLINAGLIPAAEEEGFRADRLRVQARRGEELIVERIRRTSDPDSGFLPSSFTDEHDGTARIVLPAKTFHERLAALDGSAPPPLLIFDQFEELVTQFEEVTEGEGLKAARSIQSGVVELLVDLLRDQTLPVKLLFVFREDYLAKVKKLLAACPELMHQSLRLTPPSTDALYKIIRGPFETYPGHFERELLPELAKRLVVAIETRSATGEISLSEVQVVCLRLWRASDPEALFDDKGVEGLIEDYLWSSLDEFPEELRFPAIALLSHMVTRSGARNVISADDLVERVRDEEDIDEELLNAALEQLDAKTGLVRRESRRELSLYEITSEFLVPSIRGRQEEFVRIREREKLAAEEAQRVRDRRNQLFRISAVGLLVLVAVLSSATAVIVWKWRDAIGLEHVARSQRLADLATGKLGVDPLRAVLAAALAVDVSPTREAKGAFEEALTTTHIRTLLRGDGKPVRAAAFSPNGRLVVIGGDGGTARVWDTTNGRPLTELTAPKRRVAGVGFSGDGALIVAAYDDSSARVWKSANGQLVSELRPSRTFRLRTEEFVPYQSAEFSPDAARVLTVAPDGVARVWEVKSGKELLAVRGGGKALVNSATFNSDGTRVVLTSDDRTAEVWDVARAKRLAVSRGRAGAELRAAFSPDGGRVLMTGNDGSVREWGISTGQSIMVLKPSSHEEADITDATDLSAAFSRDGEHALTVRPDGVPRLWDLAKRTAVPLKARNGVTSASFSPDSTLLVTTGRDGGTQVWDARTAASVTLLRTQKARPYNAMFSPDSRLVLTTSATGDAIVWTVRSGSRIARVSRAPAGLTEAEFSADGTSVIGVSGGVAHVQPLAGYRGSSALRGEPATVYQVAFSPDGRFIATADGLGTARVWKAAGREPVAVLTSRGSVYSVGFSADSRFLVTAGRYGARVWRAATWKPVASLRGFGVFGAALSPDGRRLAMFVYNGARVVDVRNGRSTFRIRTSSFGGRVAFSPDGLRILVSSFGSDWSIWTLANRRHIDLPGRIDDAAFSPDGAMVVTVGAFDGVRLARVGLPGSRSFEVLGAGRGRYTSAAFSPAGGLLATVRDDGAVPIWDVARRRRVSVIRPQLSVNSVAFSPDGRRLAIAGRPGPVRIFSVATGRAVRRLNGPAAPIDSASVAPGGSVAVTLSEGVGRLWDAKTGRSIALLRGRGDLLAAMFSPDGRRVVVEAADGSASSWDAASGQPLGLLMAWPHKDKGFSGESGGLAFSPEGKRIVVVLDDTARVQTRGQSKAVVLKGHTDWINHAAVSRDGRLVVTAGEDNTARVWNAASGKSVAVLRGHTDAVKTAEFSADGKRVVTAGDDSRAIVWTTTGTVVRVLRGHTSAVRDAVFSPDHSGSLVLTTSDDGTARVWDVSTGSTCAILARGGSAPIRAARFDGIDRVVTIDTDGIVRTEGVGLCSTALHHELPTIAGTFTRWLTRADRRALLQTS